MLLTGPRKVGERVGLFVLATHIECEWKALTSSRRSFILRLSTLFTPAILIIQLFSHTCCLC